MSEAPACSLRDGFTAPFEIASLDLHSCDVLEINTALNEFERKQPNLGQRIQSWPPDVQRRLNAELDKWIAARADRVVRLVSTGLYRGVAFVVLHHAAK